MNKIVNFSVSQLEVLIHALGLSWSESQDLKRMLANSELDTLKEINENIRVINELKDYFKGQLAELRI